MTQLPSKREAFRLIKSLEKQIGYHFSDLHYQRAREALDAFTDRFEHSPLYLRLKKKCDKEYDLARHRSQKIRNVLRHIHNEILATGINVMTCRKLLKLHRAVHGIVDTKSCVAECEA